MGGGVRSRRSRPGPSGVRRPALAIVATVLALAGLLGPHHVPTAAAAEDGLALTTSAAYTIVPDRRVVRVVLDLTARNLARVLSEFAIDIRPAGSLVIVSTPPGHAGAVARALDLASVDEVVGTIAGDDTIFVATTDAVSAETLAQRWLRATEEAISAGDLAKETTP